MIKQDHPYYFLAPLFKLEGAVVHLSKYIYRPDTLSDERELIVIPALDLTSSWVERTIQSLHPGQELAFHSNVVINGETLHIPMIDLSTQDPIDGRIRDRMWHFLPKAVMSNLSLFRSGRSFHAYSKTLLHEEEWVQFMGRILLITAKNKKEEIIDSRWVGHRLVAGFSSLRWSNNTQQYLSIPSKVNISI